MRSFRFIDPSASQVRVNAMSHRHCGNRHTGQVASCDDLGLEFGAVFATTSTAIDDFLGSSVHVSIKKLVDTRLLRNSTRNKMPRRDAYEPSASGLMIDAALAKAVAVAVPRALISVG